MEVLGYGHCRQCNALAPTVVLDRSGNICEGCLTIGAVPVPPETVRVEGVSYPLTPTKRNKGRKARAHGNKTKSAQKSAERRLRRAFPELYRLIYAEERAKVGLPPIPLQNTPCFSAEAYEAQLRAAGLRFDIDAVYDALRVNGIEG